MLVLVFLPLVLGFVMSLRQIIYGSGLPNRFVGFRNYADVLTDAETRAALLHTLGFMVVAVVIELIGGLIVALTLNRPFRGRGLVLGALILPWALPSVVSALLWSRVFNPDNGLLNVALVNLHILHAPKVWFASTGWAIALIGLVHAWGVLPLVALILLAGLQGIPGQLYAAAAVDGASTWKQFRHVTLPLLRPAIAVALTTGMVIVINIFDEIYTLNGTALSTRSLQMKMYVTTFQSLDFGHGTALAFLVTLASGLLAIGFVLSLRRAEQ